MLGFFLAKLFTIKHYTNVNIKMSTPCRATMRLAMQSGTLVPAARKVMPMITSGIPRVKLIMVTYTKAGTNTLCLAVCLLRCASVPTHVSPSRPWGRRTELSIVWKSGRWAGTSAPTAAGCSWGWCSEAGRSRAKTAATSDAATIHLHTQNMHEFPRRDHNRVSCSKLFTMQPWVLIN